RMMQALGERCAVVGVRGEMTAAAFRRFAGVENTFITGCPSLYSRPGAIEHLARAPRPSGKESRIAYSPTKPNKEDERTQLYRNIEARAYLTEAGNRKNRRFAQWAAGEASDPQPVPAHLRPLVRSEGGPTRSRLARYFRNRYRLFRDPHEWYTFNAEN